MCPISSMMENRGQNNSYISLDIACNGAILILLAGSETLLTASSSELSSSLALTLIYSSSESRMYRIGRAKITEFGFASI